MLWMRKGCRSLDLIDAFSLLKSERNRSLLLSTTTFSQLNIDNFGDTLQNFVSTPKRRLRGKVVDYILPRLSTALHCR